MRSAPANSDVRDVPGTTVRRHDARERLQRALYFACGIGAVVFGLLMLSGDSGIMAARGQLAEWYWWAALTVGVLLPVSYVVTAFVAPLRLLHVVAVTCAATFPVIQLLWIPAMHEPSLAAEGTPWLQGVNALPSTLAGVVFSSRAVWVFPASQLLLVPLVQLTVSDTTVADAVLDGFGAIIFCSILTGMAQAIVFSGDRLDSAVARARKSASERAVAQTQEREQTRINAIVHDDVMSVLLAASRVGATDDVREQAHQAQQSIARITATTPATDRAYTADEAIAALRALTSQGPPSATAKADFTAQPTPCEPIPGDVMAALTEAAGEALRNCARHAGPDAQCTVDLSIGPHGVVLTVTDNGAGFDPDDIDPRRLGIAVSIAERMKSLPGGSSSITSRPQHGTTVRLEWERP